MAVCSRCYRRQTVRNLTADGEAKCSNCGAPLRLDAAERRRTPVTARNLEMPMARRSTTQSQGMRGLFSAVDDPPAAAAAPLDAEAMGTGPRRSRAMAADRTASPVRPRGRRRLVFIAGAAAAVLIGAVGGAVALPSLGADPQPQDLLGGLQADVARDVYAGYGRAAARLLGAAGEDGARMRCAAASLLAGGVVAHGGGDARRIALADEILRDVKTDRPPFECVLARGYVAISRGQPDEAPRLTREQRDLPGAALYDGWRALALGQPGQALHAFNRIVREPSSRIVARFGVARAHELMRSNDTLLEYQKVLFLDASHIGAQLGVLRVAGLDPATTIEKLMAIIEKRAPDASPGDMAEAHALLGRVLRLQGRIQESDAALARATALCPTARWAAVQVAEVLAYDGKAAEAAARLQPLGSSVTQSMDARLVMAAVALLTGRPEAADALLKTAAGLQSQDPRVLYWQGRAAELGERADFEVAKDFYRRAIDRDPRFVPALLQLASVLMRQARQSEALDVLRRAEATSSTAASLQLLLGQTLLETGQLARARNAFDAALAVSPELTAAEMGIVSTFERQGDFQAAHDRLEQLLASRPDAPGARERLADVLYRLGRKSESLDLYRDLLASGKAPDCVRVGAARIYLDRGDAASAAPLIEPVARRNPAEPGALVALARLRWAQGDLPVALTEFARAMAVDDSAEAHWHHGVAMHAAGKEDDALIQLKAASTYPDAMVLRGRILLERGLIEPAVEELQRAVAMPGVSAEGHLLLGNAYERLGRADAAMASWRTAASLTASLPEVFYRMGRHEVESDHAAAGLVELRKAAAHAPDAFAGAPWLPDLYFQLGMAERATGNSGAAAKALLRFLEVAPKTAPARGAAERMLAETRRQ